MRVWRRWAQYVLRHPQTDADRLAALESAEEEVLAMHRHLRDLRREEYVAALREAKEHDVPAKPDDT